MTETFDTVVVGSGFGGSVVACRQAQAGRSVLVLERGRAWPPGSFPRTPWALQQAFWDPGEDRHGLFDVWSFRRLDAVVASGLGGGSLIYANVALRKEAEWFDERWPLEPAELADHYAAVEDVLRVTTYPYAATTPKTRAFLDAAASRGLDAELLPLAVAFAPEPDAEPVPGAQLVEERGAESLHELPRSTCRSWGECDVGCNVGAKQTLDHTYLSAAAHAGAQLRTLCEADRLRRLEDGSWELTYRVHDAGRTGHATEPPDGPAERTVQARRLVIAAGTLGTSRLLWRSANALAGLSPRLGDRVSANGDLLTFALRCEPELRPSFGPVITAGARVPGRGGYYVQEAGFPAIGEFLWHALAVPSDLWRERGTIAGLVLGALRKRADANVSGELARLFGTAETSAHMLPFLGMGMDEPDGRLHLDDDGDLQCEWAIDASRPFFERMTATMRGLAEELGGELHDTAIGELDRIVTVHPVGGCAMGIDETRGVVRPSDGQVWGSPGLHVADGSVMPGPVGANPSLTIAALAERFAAAMA